MPPTTPVATPPNASTSRTDTGTALATAPYQAPGFLDIGPAVRPITRTEISVPSQPIQVKVDTPTDWVAAFVTPITVGLAAAYIAWLNQRNSIRSAETLQRNSVRSAEALQNNSVRSAEALQKLQHRSTIANFRQAWLTDFRTFAAAYLSAATSLNFKNFSNPGFVLTPAADDQLVQMGTARASMRMMLDATKDYTQQLIAIMNEVDDCLYDTDPTKNALTTNHLTRFVDKAQEVRERAWQDIKRDLT